MCLWEKYSFISNFGTQFFSLAPLPAAKKIHFPSAKAPCVRYPSLKTFSRLLPQTRIHKLFIALQLNLAKLFTVYVANCMTFSALCDFVFQIEQIEQIFRAFLGYERGPEGREWVGLLCQLDPPPGGGCFASCLILHVECISFLYTDATADCFSFLLQFTPFSWSHRSAEQMFVCVLCSKDYLPEKRDGSVIVVVRQDCFCIIPILDLPIA